MGFVFIISSLVILYSDDYIFGDLNIVRFILLVLMFVVSMIFLIISPNVISILLGWDGLGLVSYLLVIYYQNVRSFGAGMLTVLSNRIGDVALLMVIAWVINFGSCSFIYYLEILSGSIEMELISFLVVLAAMTKSHSHTHTSLLNKPISPRRLREWGAAILQALNKNHHMAILGIKLVKPLLTKRLRLPNRS